MGARSPADAGEDLLSPPAEAASNGAVAAFGGRITRADFPAPPELADRDPSRAPAEHVGGLRAELVRRDGTVRLGRTYQQNPLRVLRPVAERPGAPALLFLMNGTAGLLDGDGQLVELDIGPDVRAFVTNQSAGRVHPCPLGHASARFDVRVADGSTLCLLPGPLIPFVGARFHQRATIDLEPGAGLVWGDILLPGRTRYRRAPERFAFERLVQELRIRRGGRLVFHERFAWSGPWDDAEVAWHFGDAEAAASLFISGPLPAEMRPELAEGEVAIQETAAGDTCVRLLGRDAERLIAAAARIALSAAAHRAGDPAPWFLDSGLLAPNHWFSDPPAPSSATAPPVEPDGRPDLPGGTRP